jgi:F-type H+-transporting ATPase subunit a
MRPVTLGLRLRGNMMGDHAVLAIFSELVPYIVPIPFYVLGIFVCFMQAFVFTLLTMIYVGLSVETHAHGDHH